MSPSADHAGGLNATTLHESASAAQARWAAGYIRQHRHRRRFAWILAGALAGYVGFGIFRAVGGVWWNALLEDYRKLNSKKYRPMAARKESRNVLSGRR